MTTPPKWATNLVLKVASDFPPISPLPNGDYLSAPTVTWSHRRVKGEAARQASTGYYKRKANELHVTAGTVDLLQFMTILHEMSHWHAGVGHGHDWTFWQTFFKMCEHYDVDDNHVLAHVKWCRGGKRVVGYVQSRVLRKQGRIVAMVATPTGIRLANVAASSGAS